MIKTDRDEIKPKEKQVLSDLILKKPRSSWMPGIAVGWRIACRNGEKHEKEE